MPDGSFPCGTADECEKAKRAIGRATNNTATAIRRMILRNMKRLGVTPPETWKSDGTLSASLLRQEAVRARAARTRSWLLTGGDGGLASGFGSGGLEINWGDRSLEGSFDSHLHGQLSFVQTAGR